MALFGLLWVTPVWGFSVPRVECTPTPAPATTRLTIVAHRMMVNGLPMNIVELHSPRPRKALLQWYARRWTLANGKPHYILYPVGPWKVIARKEGSCFYTVQLEDDGSGSVGFIGVSMPAVATNPHRGSSFPDLAGSRVILNLMSNDSGKIGETWLLVNSGGVMQNARFYMRRLHEKGWAVQLGQKVSTRRGQVAVLMFQKGNRTAQMVVEPSSHGSLILLTRVTHA
ncbi:MAG: hypothetical protein ACYCS1_06665 [Gammaproteobacteria bacterium]